MQPNIVQEQETATICCCCCGMESSLVFFNIWFLCGIIVGCAVSEHQQSIYMALACVMPPAVCLICTSLFFFWKRKSSFAYMISGILVVVVIFLSIVVILCFIYGISKMELVVMEQYDSNQFSRVMFLVGCICIAFNCLHCYFISIWIKFAKSYDNEGKRNAELNAEPEHFDSQQQPNQQIYNALDDSRLTMPDVSHSSNMM